MVQRASPSKRSVRQQFFIRAPPEKVFRAVSEPERLVTWFADAAEISLRKGGRFSFDWEEGFHHSGRVLEVVRGTTVLLEWVYDGPGGATARTRLRFSVAPKRKGTVVSVVNSGIPVGEKWLDVVGIAQGWTFFLLNLKSVVETGHDLRSKHHG